MKDRLSSTRASAAAGAIPIIGDSSTIPFARGSQDILQQRANLAASLRIGFCLEYVMTGCCELLDGAEHNGSSVGSDPAVHILLDVRDVAKGVSPARRCRRTGRWLESVKSGQLGLRPAAFIHCEEHMADVIRRVVTGHGRNGKAIVLADGPATAVRTNPLRPGYKFTDILIDGRFEPELAAYSHHQAKHRPPGRRRRVFAKRQDSSVPAGADRI